MWRYGCATGAKRMRPPLQQQSGSNSSAFCHPSSEIALQQQMLKQQHSGGNSPMGSGSLFGSLGQAGTDASQLQMHPQATGLHPSSLPSASLGAKCLRCLHCLLARCNMASCFASAWGCALLVHVHTVLLDSSSLLEI